MVVGLKQEMSVESGAASVSTGALTVEPSTQVHVYMYVQGSKLAVATSPMATNILL